MKTILRSLPIIALVCLGTSFASAAGKHTQGTPGYWTLGPVETGTTGTIAFRIKITGVTNGSTMSVYNGDPAANGWGLFIETNSRNVRTIFSGVASGSRTAILSDATWTHICMTRNGTTYNLYRDGVLVVGAETRTAITPTGTFWIGYSGHVTPPAAEYADVCYFTSELSLAQAYALAVGLSPQKMSPRPAHYWPFVRTLQDLSTGTDASAFGATSFGEHPRVYR